MADIFLWTTFGAVAGFSIFTVFLIVHFIIPMKNSFAKHIVKARRENRPVVILDAGKMWRVVVGDKKVGEEKAQIIRDVKGVDIVKTGNIGGMKYCEGVLLGIGEDFRSLVANIAIIDLMEMLDKKGWDTEEVKKRLEEISEGLKKDLGYVDEVKAVQNKYARDTAAINTQYDAKIEAITDALKPAPAPGGGENA